MSNTNMTLIDFERLLDVYGGARSHWPADARAAAAQLVARDVKARRLLAEAEALDRVLERAPLPALATEAALADRIVAAAQRSPRIVKIAGARSVAAGATRVEATVSSIATRGASLRSRLLRSEVGGLGLLVASLVAGVVIGLSSLPQQVVPALADITGAGPDRYNIAQADLFDEDVP